jgi:hypothetical protein
MGYTKRQFVSAAFEEIGLASYVFDLQPEQLESALRRLDAMMADWNAKGIRLGLSFAIQSHKTAVLMKKHYVPDSAYEAIICSLGIRFAPSFGKQVMIETKTTAKQGYDILLQRATFPLEKQLPSHNPIWCWQQALACLRQSICQTTS